MLAVLLSITSIAGYSQVTDVRPKLYASLPQTINIDQTKFERALTSEAGKEITLLLSPEFTFTGTVISNFTKYNNLHTVMLRSNENANSILQITLVADNNNLTYAGRIINSNAADGFEIKNNNGIYSLQKFETKKLLDPCNL